MDKTISIYTINCPVTGLVRYVGKTEDTKNRFRKHLTEKNRTKKCKWIIGLKNKGLKPLFEVIDTCTEAEWEQKERNYIALYKSFGAQLLNQLPGGEGGATMLGKKHKAETKNKIAQSRIGKPNESAGIANKLHKGYKIEQLDFDGNIIAIHESMRDAGKAVGRSSRRIQAMLSGKTLNGRNIVSVGGFKFRHHVKITGI